MAESLMKRKFAGNFLETKASALELYPESKLFLNRVNRTLFVYQNNKFYNAHEFNTKLNWVR